MRIALITGEYPPLEGGVGDFTHELGRALAAQGHEIHVLTSTTESTSVSEEDGLRVYRHMPGWGRQAPAQIRRWLQELRPEIVNLQYQAAAYQMKGAMPLFTRTQRGRLPAPVVVTFHDLLPPYLFPKAGPLRQWTVWQLARYAQGLILTNEADVTLLTQALPAPPRPPLRLIPIGSNIAPRPPAGYDRAAWRAALGVGPAELLIGFFGFHNRTKGIETLLMALAQLLQEGLPAHLVFIGGRTGASDPTNVAYAAEIDALIARLGLAGRVHSTGFTRPEEVSAALLATDCCALPYRAGANLRHGTLHACLAHGRAIVTTAPATPLPELRPGETVLLVPPETPTALAAALRQVWTEPTLRRRLEQGAATLAQEFSWERIAARTVEFFRTLTGRS